MGSQGIRLVLFLLLGERAWRTVTSAPRVVVRSSEGNAKGPPYVQLRVRMFCFFCLLGFHRRTSKCPGQNVLQVLSEENSPSPRSTYQPLLESFVIKDDKIVDVTIENEPEAFFNNFTGEWNAHGSHRTSLTSWETMWWTWPRFKPSRRKLEGLKKSFKITRSPKRKMGAFWGR